MTNFHYSDLKSINTIIWEHLVNGTVKKKSPFNSPAFATFSKESLRLRTMVLRKVNKESKTFTFYTDSRSNKIIDIKNRNEVSVYFYDNKKKIQLICKGKCFIENNTANTKMIWKSMKSYSKINYMSKYKPGTVISEKRKNSLLDESKSYLNFSLINVIINSIEYLILSRSGNKRAIFFYKKKSFVAKWLVP